MLLKNLMEKTEFEVINKGNTDIEPHLASDMRNVVATPTHFVETSDQISIFHLHLTFLLSPGCAVPSHKTFWLVKSISSIETGNHQVLHRARLGQLRRRTCLCLYYRIIDLVFPLDLDDDV